VVAARGEGGSWLRGYDKERTYLAAVVDGQIGDDGTLTLGYSHQQSDSTGGMWGALTFMNTDGTQNEWARDASTAQDWTKWDATTQNAFVEYAHQLEAGWQLKLSYNLRKVETDTKLFYAYLNDPDSTGPLPPTALDPVTHTGLIGYGWYGEDELTEHLVSATVNGQFSMFGRQHEALLGVSWAKSEYELRDYDNGTFPTMPAFPYAGDVVAEPDWGGLAFAGSLNQKMKRVFGATRLSMTDKLKATVGANYAEYKRDGLTYDPLVWPYVYDVPFSQSVSHLSPYGGLTYDFTQDVLGYISYSDIYLPQSQFDANNRYLDPSQGTNYEVGVKADWLDKRLLTTVALFQAKQDGLATPTGETNNFGQSEYAPVDVKSTGVELEAVGRLNNYLNLVFGYTTLKLTDEDGDDTYKWVPRNTANLMLSGRLPSYTALTLGIGGRWQSEISNVESSGFTVRQDSYAVFNTFAAYQVTPKTTVRFNINNITDEKYINTLRYAGYYGAPRNYEASLNYQF
jgi:outer membrane receptor for ferric coprogen and ferric-rhodotorulic acid